jgi:hypothetical protein
MFSSFAYKYQAVIGISFSGFPQRDPIKRRPLYIVLHQIWMIFFSFFLKKVIDSVKKYLKNMFKKT